MFGIINCKNCEKEVILKIERDISRKKYCSKECMFDYQTKNTEIRNCIRCKKEFKIRGFSKQHRKGIFCSKFCHLETQKQKNVRQNKKAWKCLYLREEGKSVEEISQLTGFNKNTIYSYLNKLQYRRNDGTSHLTLIKRFKKNKTCQICNESRALDVCHILPARKGGQLVEENVLILCPTHHRLFDHNKLTENEFNFIKKKVEDTLYGSTAF